MCCRARKPERAGSFVLRRLVSFFAMKTIDAQWTQNRKIYRKSNLPTTGKAMICGYNGRSATMLDAPSRLINDADRSRNAMPNPKPIPIFTESQKAQFWLRVDKGADDACWLWRGYMRPNGYGEFMGACHYRAHRVAYTLAYGPIPDVLTVDHLCGNRACVNPLHLEAVTAAENALRGLSRPSLIKYPNNKRPAGRRRRHRARGLCAECSTPSVKFRCNRCRDIKRLRRRAKRTHGV